MPVSGTPNPARYADTSPVKSRVHRNVRNALLALATGMFATAAALAVMQTDAVPLTHETQQLLSLPDGFSTETPPAVVTPDPYTQVTRIVRGDTLETLLQRLHIQEQGLLTFLTHDPSARAVYKLYPGRELTAGLDTEGSLRWLRYHHTPGTTEQGQVLVKWLEVRPDGQGGFEASEQSQPAQAETKVVEGVINQSLFATTDRLGVPDAITLQMTDILSSKVDFLRGLRKGDHFRMVYETYTHEGRPAGSGRILALEFTNNKRHHNALWFEPEQGSGAYYDFDGNSLRGMFLRAPLKFTRISSGFGMRRHPVHGYTAQHKGVDYAAPTGTPIHATADGVISFRGQQRGYGNIIIVDHHSGYSTRYAHQSRFATGLQKGSRVTQGQLIGYVGMTGVATGPHLHYEVRKHNEPLNPQSLNIPIAQTLEGAQKQAFERLSAQYREQLQLLAHHTMPVAETAQDS